MSDQLTTYLQEHRDAAKRLLRALINRGKPFLLRSDLQDELQVLADELRDRENFDATPLGQLVGAAQEAAIEAPWIHLAARFRIGRWNYYRLHAETLDAEETTVSDFLAFKEDVVNGRTRPDRWPLEVDLGPFNREFPRLKESRSIGDGVSFLNRRLSSEIFRDLDKGDRRLLEFLRVHSVKGRQLMLNGRIADVPELRGAIRRADELLCEQPKGAQWDDVAPQMRKLGFEPGWGKTVERMRDTLNLLSEILEAPDPSVLEKFLARIPMIFSVVILSPHGYFGQSNVLGLPDTGGQVVYILDQTRALEQELYKRLDEQGIDIEPQILIVTRLIPDASGTTCNQRIERVAGTSRARILRVPFRDRSGAVVPHWISRFEIWPYLERYAIDAEQEILKELGGRPALIIGNYSDGNLVASIISGRLQVTQCNVAHALEKSKYTNSDLYWRESEATYHFACQFTADLISMNTADFIITSTYQEIRGTEGTVGQYENYAAFTMPDLYRVVNGIDIFDPKFNVVSPGADPEICFPYMEESRRLTNLQERLDALILGDGGGTPCRGGFADASKPIIFTMARLDRVKNVAGLVKWYGRCARLRERANLLVVGGHLDVERSTDHEEREQIDALHELFEAYDLEGQVRWVEFQADRKLVGELYRRVADARGVFVQPAHFEAYGLTVVEAMSSGLPVFATCHGGPSEVIEHGVSGFHIDPEHGDAAAGEIADFFERCSARPEHWLEISQGALQRVKLGYTWELYAQRMMTLARVYGFWKYVTDLEREETRCYLEMLYALQYRRLAESLPN